MTTAERAARWRQVEAEAGQAASDADAALARLVALIGVARDLVRPGEWLETEGEALRRIGGVVPKLAEVVEALIALEATAGGRASTWET